MTWKLAMPPAEQWQALTDQLDVAKPVKGEGKVLIKNDIGMRWKLNAEVLERVGVVLDVMYRIEVGDVRDFIQGYGSLGYAQLSYNGIPTLGAFNYRITVNPYLSPEAANYAIWHEIQHMFQLEEGRMSPQLDYDPEFPTEEDRTKYKNDPNEKDADAMALKLHQLQQYSVVVPISMLEGSEKDEYEQLLEEGWPRDEAQEAIREMIESSEIPLSTVIATRGLEPLSKVAMPYYNNVWYHVTSADYLDDIAKKGLAPREVSQQSTNWPVAPVASNAVYLWPTISMARSYFSQLRVKNHVILRVTNIDQTKLAPDHEEFAIWLADRWENEMNWPESDPEEYAKLFRTVLSQSDTATRITEDQNDNSYSFEDALQILAEITPQLRRELVAHFAETDPSAPVMYYGTIPPEDIAVASLLTFEQLEDEFIQNNQDHPFLQHPDDRVKPAADEEELEQDYHQKLDQYLVDVMDDKQIQQFINVEDIHTMIEEAYDDHRDQWEKNFTYQPLQQYPRTWSPDYGPEPSRETPWYHQTPVL